MTGKVLIVDDEPDIRELLEVTLGRMSLITESAGTVATALSKLSTQRFDLCLTDMRLPDGDGLRLVDFIQRQYAHMPVAVITAHGNTETAIRALKSGAFDFVSKPVDLQKLRDLVTAAIKLSAQHTAASETPPVRHISITGRCPAIVSLREQITRLARSQAPVFISGESGSGKELAARSIHRQSARADAPFIAVNCGAIPSELMESELFGHVKGSFTGADKDKTGLFQAAAGGTLFLDEVADLPLHMQVKLLRVIQEKSVRPVGSQTEYATDVRLLSASHKNLAEEVRHQRFRQDLYYRINVIELAVPSLRERREDIPELTLQILQRLGDETGGDGVATISDEAMQALAAYSFPGNIRELENILQRALTLSEHRHITLRTLALPLASQPPVQRLATAAPGAMATMAVPNVMLDEDFSLERHLEMIERQILEQALQECRWNRTLAARRLGLSFRSLRYRLKKLGLDS